MQKWPGRTVLSLFSNNPYIDLAVGGCSLLVVLAPPRHGDRLKAFLNHKCSVHEHDRGYRFRQLLRRRRFQKSSCTHICCIVQRFRSLDSL